MHNHKSMHQKVVISLFILFINIRIFQVYFVRKIQTIQLEGYNSHQKRYCAYLPVKMLIFL